MITFKQMRELEKKANDSGISDEILMENAGSNALGYVNNKFNIKGKSILIFCGTGNNTGDGLVFARHSLLHGAKVKVFFVKGKNFLKPLPTKHYTILKNLKLAGYAIEFYEKAIKGVTADIIIDAMMGTGIKGEVRDEYKQAIKLFNSMPGKKISLDIPSGLNPENEKRKQKSEKVKPEITISFYDRKKGMDRSNCGQIVVVGIGIPKL